MTNRILENSEANQRIIDFLYDGLLRPDGKYIKEGNRAVNKKGNFSTKLKGNLGRMLFTGYPEGDCGNWIGASPRAHDLARDPVHDGISNNIYIGALPSSQELYFGKRFDAYPFDEELPYLTPSGDEYDFRKMELVGTVEENELTKEEIDEFSKPFPFEDSEYLLLNGLAFMLKIRSVDTGEVYLLTERIPCASCTHVINGFAKMFSKIPVNILYMFDSDARDAKDFLRECTQLHSVSLTRLKRTEDAMHVTPTFITP
ncbi:MAG: hypothetical protein EOP14_04725 [Pseudomonas sp.]|nr:MAG: hypothetical protein EOP14_04725 [Pseudomonas sp.]